MRRTFRAILCGTLAALIVGGAALAVNGGGFPSRPRFAAVGITVTPSALWCSSISHLDLASGSLFSGCGVGTGIAYNAYYDGTNWRYASSSTAAVYFANSGLYQSAGSGTAGAVITLNTAGASAVIVSAAVTNTGTSCSIFASNQGGLTCTFNSSTSIKINFSPAFSFEPACAVTAYQAGVTASITSPGSGSVTVGLSGSGNFGIVCSGNPR